MIHSHYRENASSPRTFRLQSLGVPLRRDVLNIWILIKILQMKLQEYSVFFVRKKLITPLRSVFINHFQLWDRSWDAVFFHSFLKQHFKIDFRAERDLKIRALVCYLPLLEVTLRVSWRYRTIHFILSDLRNINILKTKNISNSHLNPQLSLADGNLLNESRRLHELNLFLHMYVFFFM